MEIYTPKLHHYEDEKQMISSLNTILLNIAEDAIYNTGIFRIAVAGGTTPMYLYSVISKLSLNWPQVEIFQTDERFVSSDNTLSNQKNIAEAFTEAINKGAEFQRISIAGNYLDSVKSYNHDISMLAEPFFDLVILGVGQDGHIASLFPNQNYLRGDTDWVLATIAPEPYQIEQRISLSINTLLSSNNVFVYLTGDEKSGVIEEIFHGNQSAVNYPVKTLLAHPNVEIFYSAEVADIED
jgi:6-phosphogluconolactonase